MNGSFRKKPNGSVELRVWLDMPDGSHVQKSFCRRTRIRYNKLRKLKTA